MVSSDSVVVSSDSVVVSSDSVVVFSDSVVVSSDSVVISSDSVVVSSDSVVVSSASLKPTKTNPSNSYSDSSIRTVSLTLASDWLKIIPCSSTTVRIHFSGSL